jgi:hypothetical protein
MHSLLLFVHNGEFHTQVMSPELEQTKLKVSLHITFRCDYNDDNIHEIG